LAIIILHAITGVCTPACLLAASISVETVTPPGTPSRAEVPRWGPRHRGWVSGQIQRAASNV